FGPSVSQAQIEDVCRRMLALKEDCVRKGTGERYIVSSKGGRNCSVESVKASFTHGFVVEFANDADRMYYVEEDPAHLAFVESLKGVVTNAGVVDFVPDAF
ncbi:MAG: hypothetical protein Q9173_007188, partial [Seirophora scorigena]